MDTSKVSGIAAKMAGAYKAPMPSKSPVKEPVSLDSLSAKVDSIMTMMQDMMTKMESWYGQDQGSESGMGMMNK